MKNNSDEIIMGEKNPNFFPKIIKPSTILDDSKKNNIITNPSELKDSLARPVFENKLSFRISKIKIIFTIIYFILIILLEFLYRDYLFDKSIRLQESLQLNKKYFFLLKMSKIISFFGAEFAAVFFTLLIFLFMPLNYSFLILQCIIYSAYFTNTLKMIYQSDRPSWNRPSWKSKYLTYSCDNGFGNPSGHAFTSINLYLCLVHIFMKYFIVRGVLRILFFMLGISISILIILSRVILAAHSINQILYGSCLGIGVYFILIHIIGYHNYSSIEFYQHIKKKKVKKIYYIINTFLLILTVFIYLFTKNQDTSEALSITALLGAQFGIDMLFILLKNNNYMINYSLIEWNKNKKFKYGFLRFIVILVSSFGILFYFTFPEEINIFFIFVFKSAMAFFLGMAGIYSLGIFLCIKFKIANKDIYKMDALHEITAES